MQPQDSALQKVLSKEELEKELLLQIQKNQQLAVIVHSLEETATQWKEAYDTQQEEFFHCKNILNELVQLKIMKEENDPARMQDYEARKPLVWKAAYKYIIRNIQPSEFAYADALIDVNAKLKQAKDTLKFLVKHHEKNSLQPDWMEAVKQMLAVLDGGPGK